MKYLLIFSLIFFTAEFSLSQLSSKNSFKYSVTFKEGTFEGEDAKTVVREFREHIFAQVGRKFDFHTRLNKTGELYFETSHPIEESLVSDFFHSHQKEYITFENVMAKPRFYAFH